MTRLALGTAQFGTLYGISNLAGQINSKNAKAILELAWANEIKMLDTAIEYGTSEITLGAVGIQNFDLVTKLPMIPDDCDDLNTWFNEEINNSFYRLGIQSAYGLLLHHPEQLLGPRGSQVYEALENLKARKLTRKIGISIYSPDILNLLVHKYKFDIVQAPLNLVDNRLYTSGWLQRLKNDAVEVHTRSVFLQGLLLMPRIDIPEYFSPWASLWNRWEHWLKKSSFNAVQACLGFPFSFPQIDRVIVGVDSVEHLIQISSSLKELVSIDKEIVYPNIASSDEKLLNPNLWEMGEI